MNDNTPKASVFDTLEPQESVRKPKLKSKFYEDELETLQAELVKLQSYIKEEGLKVVVIFEGRDAAGKGGVIKRITERLNPRICRVEALGTATEREKSQWWFQRYVSRLPAAGKSCSSIGPGTTEHSSNRSWVSAPRTNTKSS